MTREEMDFIGSMNMCNEISNEAYKKIMCHCEEQEPCEDAISRQAARKIILDEFEGWPTDEEVAQLKRLTKQIDDLPSVTPKQEMGYWMHYEGTLYCSKCGAEFYDEITEYCGDDVPKYCPDCGQPKMRFPESEDKG